MSEQTPTAARAPLFPVARSWKVAMIVGIVMVLLAMLGVGLTTTSRDVAPAYWVSLVPIYGLLCIAMARARARHEGHPYHTLVVRQVFHWLGVAVALALDFAIRSSGEETGRASGLNALLVLSLGCFLAGVHLEWLFALVGLLLTLTLIIITTAEEYIWLMFIVGGLAIAGMLVFQWLMSKKHAQGSAAAGAH